MSKSADLVMSLRSVPCGNPRSQSLVAKIESGERKLDVCQFIDYMRILEADPAAVMKQIMNTIQGL